jgi:hypothetical protein
MQIPRVLPSAPAAAKLKARPAMSLSIPPLPDSWPYHPRAGFAEWEQRAGIDLGSLGAGWQLTVPRGLAIPEREDQMTGVFGRGGVQRRGDLVLRPYRRGGLLRFLVQSRYASPRRFEREWLVHRAVWESGFPTVQPLGFASRRQGLAFEGVYLTGFVEGRPWPADWSAGLAKAAALQEAILALADWGLWAPDLNATNVLLTEEGLRLLDWDRSAFVPGSRLLPLYLRRLQRSLAKLAAPEAVVSSLLSWMKEEGHGGR